MMIFVQDQGMRKKQPQVYSCYSEDYFLSITQRLGKKTIYGWTLIKTSSALPGMKFPDRDSLCKSRVLPDKSYKQHLFGYISGTGKG
jgi:hypothetical protein